MSITREPFDVWEGQGRLEVGNDSFPVSYYVQWIQDIHHYRAGGVEKNLSGVQDSRGNLTFTGGDLPPRIPGGLATLCTEDGRRLGIVLPPSVSTTDSVSFVGSGAVE